MCVCVCVLTWATNSSPILSTTILELLSLTIRALKGRNWTQHTQILPTHPPTPHSPHTFTLLRPYPSHTLPPRILPTHSLSYAHTLPPRSPQEPLTALHQFAPIDLHTSHLVRTKHMGCFHRSKEHLLHQFETVGVALLRHNQLKDGLLPLHFSVIEVAQDMSRDTLLP